MCFITLLAREIFCYFPFMMSILRRADASSFQYYCLHVAFHGSMVEHRTRNRKVAGSILDRSFLSFGFFSETNKIFKNREKWRRVDFPDGMINIEYSFRQLWIRTYTLGPPWPAKNHCVSF